MLSPKFVLCRMQKKYNELVKHVAGLSILKGGIRNRLEICSPKFLGYSGYTVTRNLLSTTSSYLK